jgi:hypothetical protein
MKQIILIKGIDAPPRSWKDAVAAHEAKATTGTMAH